MGAGFRATSRSLALTAGLAEMLDVEKEVWLRAYRCHYPIQSIHII